MVKEKESIKTAFELLFQILRIQRISKKSLGFEIDFKSTQGFGLTNLDELM